MATIAFNKQLIKELNELPATQHWYEHLKNKFAAHVGRLDFLIYTKEDLKNYMLLVKTMADKKPGDPIRDFFETSISQIDNRAKFDHTFKKLEKEVDDLAKSGKKKYNYLQMFSNNITYTFTSNYPTKIKMSDLMKIDVLRNEIGKKNSEGWFPKTLVESFDDIFNKIKLLEDHVELQKKISSLSF